MPIVASATCEAGRANSPNHAVASPQLHSAQCHRATNQQEDRQQRMQLAAAAAYHQAHGWTHMK
jgi:hypothetical protein